MEVKFSKEFQKSFDKLFSTRPYYRLMRFFNAVKRSPRTVKYFFQRGFRGYDDTSWWDLYTFLGNDIVRHLKIFKDAKRMGVPGQLCRDKNGKSVGTKQGEKKWNDILDKMISGFEDLLVDPTEKKPWKLYQAEKITKKEWQRREKRDYKEAQKNAKLFIEYFNSLWD